MNVRNISLYIGLAMTIVEPAAATDTLTVLIVATPAAITKMGGPQAAEGKVYSDIDSINQSFIRSGIDGYVSIVRTDRLEYVEDRCMYDMLSDLLTDRESFLSRLHQERYNYSADIVMIIVDEPSQCGIAGAYGDVAQAFMIVHYECLGANYSMARELGYLLGCGNNESQSGRFNPASQSAYAYYFENEEDIEGQSFSTIMGYTDEAISSAEDDFDMIPYWSSADTINVRYNNRRVGDKSHDNAGQIRSALPSVSNYRYTYGMLQVDNDILLPYNHLELSTKRKLTLSDVDMEPNSNAVIKSKQVRLTRGTKIKRGAKVRISTNQ